MENKKNGKTASLADEALPIGTNLLDDQFTITGFLGAGGFGISYRAKDNVLGRTIVIKECFPCDICTRKGKSAVARSNTMAELMQSTVEKFMSEARNLAKLRHPNIVGVHRAFEENKTAYMALDLIEGRELYEVIKSSSPLSPARIKSILVQLLDAIEMIHEEGILHRDISPDNILIEESGTPVLIDFG
ncbi:MAG: serine/threonine protein kinase, partial [Boseongicola sp.]